MSTFVPPPVFITIKTNGRPVFLLLKAASLWLGLLFLFNPLFARADNSMYTVFAYCNQIGSTSPYLSGTYCNASGGFLQVGPSQIFVTSMTLSVNGTQIQATVPAGEGRPINQQSDGLGNVIDSTHFPDGASVTVTFTVTFSDGSSLTKTASSSTYNKAYIYGNQLPPDGIGSLGFGEAAVQAVNARVGPTNHTILPAAGQLKRHKADILGDIPTPTVFYCYTHGDINEFGDSSATPHIDALTWITNNDVSNAVANKTPAQPPSLPPYNFVFIDACTCGASDSLATAFGIHGTGWAWMGWKDHVDDSQHNVNWTNRLFQQLALGYQLQDAIDWADTNGGQEQAGTNNGVPINVEPVIYGDTLYKLHGVYGKKESLAWY